MKFETHLLVSGADYADLYDALYQACNNLVGTTGITARRLPAGSPGSERRRDEPAAAAQLQV